MATAAVARPGQALRQRRDAPRPSVTKRPTTTTITTVDGAASSEPAHKRRRLNEPYVRTSAHILRKHRGKPSSFKVHLHDTFFRFDGQEGSLPYNSPMRFVIQHLRDQTVPHELLEELLANNVPFYDGCLIVEVHNHRTAAGKERSKQDSGAAADQFSMHNYNQHITPSPFVPYPKAATEENAEQSEAQDADTATTERQNKGKAKDGPKINLVVLHPNQLTMHHEMLILADTPASEARGQKKGADGATPSSGQPQTPQLSVPPTPTTTSRGPLSQPQKMALEEGDFYSFQAEVLVATLPPLYLEPASTPQESDKIIAMLSNPLHEGKPPSPQTRKRTTAEMAADDAQAAEAERRMLIMDERIKPSARTGAGTATNENQGTAASLVNSRFKTLEMVRQKHEEQDRIKKEDEARAELEKRQANESQQAQAKIMQQKMRLQQQQQQTNQQNAALVTQQRNEMMRQQQMVALQRQAHAQAQMTDHGHPQANGVQNGQQGNFQQSAMSQGSPVARQQTPMVNSSPMLPNGGFPMAATSSQGAGSPPRPTSAAMHNRNNGMARQVSQQQHGSQQNTPQMPQGTPSMAQAVPNRQMTQTPRMPPGSPATAMQGTPTSAAMNMLTPQMGQQGALTPEQMAMLQLQRQNQAQAQGGMHAGSPPQGMTPEQIQQIHRAQAQARHNQMLAQAQQAQRAGNPQMMQQIQNQQRANMMRQAALQAQMQQNMMQQAGQAGSPGGIHQATPQMGHAHPSQTPGHQQQQLPQNAGQAGGGVPTPEQTAAAQAKAQNIAMQRQMMSQLQGLAHQHGGFHNIPPQIISTMTPAHRSMLQQTLQNQRNRQVQAQAQARAQQQQQQQLQANGEQVPAQPNPAYMAALRNNQAAMRAQLHANQQQQQQQGQNGAGIGGMPMNVNMGGMPGQGQPNGGNGGQSGLDQYFANMQNALTQQPGRGQQGGGGMQ